MMKIKLAVMFVVMFLALNHLSFSQIDSSTHKNKHDFVKTSVNKLQQKILLANDQDTVIEQILFNYVDENSVIKNKDIILNKIEKLLNNRQKDKFEIIKNDWWNHFIKLLNTK